MPFDDAFEGLQCQLIFPLVVLHQADGHQRPGHIAALRIRFHHLPEPHNGLIIIAHQEISIGDLKTHIIRIIGIGEPLDHISQRGQFTLVVPLQALDHSPLEQGVILAGRTAVDQPVIILHGPVVILQ